MSTEFYNRNFRMPKSSNSSKLSNYSMSFDGSSERITVPYSDIFNQSVYSFSLWINNSSNSGVSDDGIITADTSNRGFAILQDNQTLKFNPNILGATGQIDTSNFFNTIDTWIHCVITFDGTNLIVYKNGISVNTSTTGNRNLNANNNNLTIGDSQIVAGREFNGKLDHVAIFDYALSSSQVTSLYGNSTDGVGNPMSLSTKPVAYYKIGDKAAFNGSEYLVTNAASEVYSPYGLNFDSASSDYIDCGNSTNLRITPNLTISAWFKTSTSQIGKFITRDGLASATRDYALYQNGTNLQFWVSQSGNITETILTSTGFTANDGNWHHAVGVCNGTNIELYIDGVLNVSGTNSISGINTSTYINEIGSRTTGTSNFFNGQLSNISIWNAALTSSQVTELYGSGTPTNLNNHSAYSSLVSWWQLGENSSFDGTNWTVLNEISTGPNGVSANMTEADLVNGVGTTANGLSSGMGGADNIIGDAPYSTANAISYGMGVDALSTDVPS